MCTWFALLTYLLFIQQVLLNIYYLPGIMLGRGDSAMNQAGPSLAHRASCANKKKLSPAVDAIPGVCNLVKKKKKKMSVHKEKGAFFPGGHSPKLRSSAWEVEVGAGLQPHTPSLAKSATLFH